MENVFSRKLQGQSILEGLRGVLRELFETNQAAALFAPLPTSGGGRLMPTLITDVAKLDTINPLAPLYPLNAATLLARLTRKASGMPILAVLRPCEVRAYTELIKLKQATREDVLLVSLDCLGAYPNRQIPHLEEALPDDLTQAHYAWQVQGASNPYPEVALSQACQACDHPVADSADMTIALLGTADTERLWLEARTEKGLAWLKKLALTADTLPEGRARALDDLLQARTAALETLTAETAEAINGLDNLATYFARCVGCYNCRVICPVCYCRECVFTTDVFDHEPFQYLQWAQRKKSLPLPSDNLFFHITRLAHTSLACVGCGQCSNACPNEIPVMNVLRTVGRQTQAAFDYIPGLKPDQPPPLSVFKEDEYRDVVGV